MLRKVLLPNKLLSLEHVGNTVYIGDSRGFIFQLEYPFLNHKKIVSSSSPISSIIAHKSCLFYANWDGEVCFTDFKMHKSVKIIREIVKCMTIFKEHLFVSIDHMIYILDTDLNIKGRLEPPHKVLVFDSSQDKCTIGMSVPFLGEIVEAETGVFELVNIRSSGHDTSILSIHGKFTGSSDGKLMKDDRVIHSTSGWIHSIFSEELFSSGKLVLAKAGASYKDLYAHEDDVMRVIKIQEKILSIGLDGFVCLWEEEKIIREELEEIEELNRMFN